MNSANKKEGPPGVAWIASVFTRYANFTLGDGSATIAVLHRELLEKRQWVSNDNFVLCFALSRLTPGTNLLAFCTGIGWLLRRLPGALAALLAASIPCAIMVTVLTAAFSRWQSNAVVQAAIERSRRRRQSRCEFQGWLRLTGRCFGLPFMRGLHEWTQFTIAWLVEIAKADRRGSAHAS